MRCTSCMRFMVFGLGVNRVRDGVVNCSAGRAQVWVGSDGVVRLRMARERGGSRVIPFDREAR